MTNDLLSAMDAAANAARLCSAGHVFVSMDISHDELDNMKQILKADFTGTSSPIAAAGAAAALEKRSIAVAPRPGADDAREAARSRLPVVIFSYGRPSDVMAVKDEGCAMIFCEGIQDLLDTIILTYKACEDSKVMQPCIVCWNGPNDFCETVSIPSDQMIKNFVPALKVPNRLDPKKHSSIAAEESPEGLMQQHKAMENFLKSLSTADEGWKKRTKRSWPAAECYRTDDADIILVTYGYHSATAKAAVDSLRNKGKKAGMIRIRVFRPFPTQSISILSGKKAGVLDFSSSPGTSPPLCREVMPYAMHTVSFISFQKYLSEKDFIEMFEKIEKSEKGETFFI